MAELGTMACVEICRHCTYEQIYTEQARERGETPLSYDDWLNLIWFPFLDTQLTHT